jgi:hypothetical protein
MSGELLSVGYGENRWERSGTNLKFVGTET